MYLKQVQYFVWGINDKKHCSTLSQIEDKTKTCFYGDLTLIILAV